MSSVLVASQLPEAFNAALAQHVPTIDIVSVPPGPPQGLPRHAEVLVAAPFRKAGGILTPTPPAGWPFDLRWIQLVSVGIDFYPDWLFRDPPVTSARGSSAVALAEFALAAILADTKRLPDIWIGDASAWAPQPLRLVQGTTLGIYGFGAIGEALAPRALALGMKVLATRKSDRPVADGVERVASLADMVARVDHLVVAAPATPETFHAVNRVVLGGAKPGLHIINVARGALIDDDALLEALREERVARATLDVTYPEPLPAGHPFYSHPRIRLSPHTSVHTPDTRQNLALRFAENFTRFQGGVPLADVVDPSRGY